MNDFATIEEAQLTATQWLWIYINERPNMPLGGITPAMKLAEAFILKPLLHAPVKNGRITIELQVFNFLRGVINEKINHSLTRKEKR